ncbi:MAG: TadA family conjugal transfer-associated ATPase [Propionibacteriaceae bacterium]|jgi:pilus assembly protein CpaF|nr:TadA family conjugal transfer-associated ATPase [Propionibacteriaceae bacterium]
MRLTDAVITPVKAQLALLGRMPTAADVAEALRRCDQVVSDAAVIQVQRAVRRDSVGAGLLDPLLTLPGVTDVLVNGPDRVYIDRGDGPELTEVRFESDDAVRQLAARLAASVGRRLDDGSPFVDARLASGVRVHAILATVASPGTCLSLRVPSTRRLGLDDWVTADSLHPVAAEVLRRVIETKTAFLVTGGTGSGKTTLLSALIGLIAPDQRILVVEDSLELEADHPHLVRLESRPANAEGAGLITMTDLIRQALRMRPDRIVVGEVRGAELTDLLRALNTGHEGGCATIHANSVADVPARLEALAALGGLNRMATHAQVAAGLSVIIHVAREGRQRFVREIGLLRRQASGLVETVSAWRLCDGVAERGPGWETLDRNLNQAGLT